MSTQFDELIKELERQAESTHESERLTADDFAVTINAKGDDFGGGPDLVPLQSHERAG